MTEHLGLPVAGYTPQSDAKVAAVNAIKQLEEGLLRVLDTMKNDAVKVDQRWLAIGRVTIEQGFMAINRSIFQPRRISLPGDNT